MSHDYRGKKSSVLEEAHARAHAADTLRDVAPMCSHCGMASNKQMNRTTTVSQLKVCGKCKSVQYCCRECQVEAWPEHKKVCKQLAKERKELKRAKRKMAKSKLQKQVNELEGDMAEQAAKIIEILQDIAENPDDEDGDDDSKIVCAIANRLTEDLPLLTEIHTQQADTFYPLLRKFLERDLEKIQSPSSIRSASDEILYLPSWNMAAGILRCFPQEDGFIPPRTTGGVSAYSEERSAVYFRACWSQHLDLSVGLWKGTCQGNPDMFVTCKDMWRQLTSCLVHQRVAQAIFESYRADDDTLEFSDAKSPRLAPLISMLNLREMADDLEGLTNQVAALLVVHARNLHASSAQLERSITKKMKGHEKVQWRQMSLVIAKEMVHKKRQLTTEEYRPIMARIQRGVPR